MPAPRRFAPILRSALQVTFFEELPLGAEWTTRRRTVTEADLVNFSAVAGDFNPLHVDAEYARTTNFGGLVVPAGFIASAAIGLGSMDVPTAATVGMVGMTWRFLRPLKVGDTMQTRWRLTRKRSVENPRWGLAVWRVDVTDQRGEVVAEGDVMRLVARAEIEKKDAAPARRRRRRRGSGSSVDPQAIAETQAALPAPAPADTPPPAKRRRRRRPSGERAAASANGAAAGEGVPGQPGAEAATAPATSAPTVDTKSHTTPAEPLNFAPLNDASPTGPRPAGDPETAVTKVLRRLRGPRRTP